MAAEDGVLALFDLYWFQTLILHRKNLSPPPPQSTTPEIAVDRSPETLLVRRHRRSHSEGPAPFLSLQIRAPKLQTIFSGKIPKEYQIGEQRYRRELRRRRKKGESKSLTDLEFEELKGLMDLGFRFSDAEAVDPRLISIVPGIQRLREAARDGGSLSSERSSSATDFGKADKEEWGTNCLSNWRIPAAGEGIDMKNHLRLWAQAVASAVL